MLLVFLAEQAEKDREKEKGLIKTQIFGKTPSFGCIILITIAE